MKYILAFLTLILLYLILLPNVAFAQVFINEFSVDSTPQQVELFNSGVESIDISNWYIDDNAGTTYFTIPPDTILIPNACIIFSAEFNWNKSSADAARLYNSTAPPTSSDAQLVDAFTYSRGAGTNNSFSRVPDGTGEWEAAVTSHGNFNLTEISCIRVSSPTATPTVTTTPSPEISTGPSPTSITQTISYDNIYISEVSVYPESGTEKLEFFNNNDFDVVLTNWYIDDLENAGAAPRQINLNIPAKGYTVYELVTGIFNNDSDHVRVLDFNKTLKDSFEYSTSARGKSWGRVSYDSEVFCPQETSFGSPNNKCIFITITPSPTAISSETEMDSTLSVTEGLADKSNERLTVSENTVPTGFNRTPAPGANLSENSFKNLYTNTNPEGEILGENSKKIQPDKSKNALIKSAVFSSSSYSILAFISLLRKIKSSCS